MKVKEDFQTMGEVINMVRSENKGKVFSVKELKDALGGIIPVNDMARGWLVESEIIVRVGKGKYTFPKDPISWICVKKFYDLSRKKNKEYRSRRNEKRKFIVSSDHTDVPVEPITEPKAEPVAVPQVQASTPEPKYTEEKAVAFLKNLGYIILKMM